MNTCGAVACLNESLEVLLAVLLILGILLVLILRVLVFLVLRILLILLVLIVLVVHDVPPVSYGVLNDGTPRHLHAVASLLFLTEIRRFIRFGSAFLKRYLP